MNTTSNTHTGPALTLEKLEAAMQALKPCTPIADWLRAKGYDPEEGWVLVLPERYRAEFGLWPEACVRVSWVVAEPTVMLLTQIGRVKPMF